MEIIKFQLSKLTASKAVQASTWHVATMVVDLPASASALLWKYIMLTFHLSNIFENQKTWWENRFYIIILDIEWSWYIGKWHLTPTLSQQPHSLVGTLPFAALPGTLKVYLDGEMHLNVRDPGAVSVKVRQKRSIWSWESTSCTFRCVV